MNMNNVFNFAFPHDEITDGTQDQASKLMPTKYISHATDIWAAQPSTPNLLTLAPGLGVIKGKTF